MESPIPGAGNSRTTSWVKVCEATGTAGNGPLVARGDSAPS